MVTTSSGKIVWPPRNLGAAEGWGRIVEKSIQEVTTQVEREVTASGNRNRANAAAADRLTNQLNEISTQQERLSNLVTRVVESTEADSNQYPVTGQGTAASLGPQVVLDPPEWASHALVVAAAERISGTLTGAWTGKIEYIAKNSNIGLADVGAYRNMLDIGIGPESTFFSSFAYPILVPLNPDGQLFLRHWGGADGPGTQTTAYQVKFSYSVTWI